MKVFIFLHFVCCKLDPVLVYFYSCKSAYSVEVICHTRINDITDSNYTFPFDIAPSGPPRNVQLNASYSRALLFQWDQPSCRERNGIVITYDLNFTNVNTREYNIITSDTTMKIFQHLSPYSNYTLQIAARTVAGPGPFSDLIWVTTEEEGEFHAMSNIHCDAPPYIRNSNTRF